MQLMNLVTSGLPKTGSGGTSRLGTGPLRGILAALLPSLRLGPLGAVLRPALLAALDAGRIERAADDVVAHARQVLHAAPADQHDRVLLQIVADAGNVGRHLH